MSMDDLTPDAAVQHVLLPLPPGCGCAGTASRQAAAFHIWRRRALFSGKQDPKGRRRRLSDMPQHVGVQHGAQLQGRITLRKRLPSRAGLTNVCRILRMARMLASVNSTSAPLQAERLDRA